MYCRMHQSPYKWQNKLILNWWNSLLKKCMLRRYAYIWIMLTLLVRQSVESSFPFNCILMISLPFSVENYIEPHVEYWMYALTCYGIIKFDFMLMLTAWLFVTFISKFSVVIGMLMKSKLKIIVELQACKLKFTYKAICNDLLKELVRKRCQNYIISWTVIHLLTLKLHVKCNK